MKKIGEECFVTEPVFDLWTCGKDAEKNGVTSKPLRRAVALSPSTSTPKLREAETDEQQPDFRMCRRT